MQTILIQQLINKWWQQHHCLTSGLLIDCHYPPLISDQAPVAVGKLSIPDVPSSWQHFPVSLSEVFPGKIWYIIPSDFRVSGVTVTARKSPKHPPGRRPDWISEPTRSTHFHRKQQQLYSDATFNTGILELNLPRIVKKKEKNSFILGSHIYMILYLYFEQ